MRWVKAAGVSSTGGASAPNVADLLAVDWEAWVSVWTAKAAIGSAAALKPSAADDYQRGKATYSPLDTLLERVRAIGGPALVAAEATRATIKGKISRLTGRNVFMPTSNPPVVNRGAERSLGLQGSVLSAAHAPKLRAPVAAVPGWIAARARARDLERAASDAETGPEAVVERLVAALGPGEWLSLALPQPVARGISGAAIDALQASGPAAALEHVDRVARSFVPERYFPSKAAYTHRLRDENVSQLTEYTITIEFKIGSGNMLNPLARATLDAAADDGRATGFTGPLSLPLLSFGNGGPMGSYGSLVSPGDPSGRDSAARLPVLAIHPGGHIDWSGSTASVLASEADAPIVRVGVWHRLVVSACIVGKAADDVNIDSVFHVYLDGIRVPLSSLAASDGFCKSTDVVHALCEAQAGLPGSPDVPRANVTPARLTRFLSLMHGVVQLFGSRAEGYVYVRHAAVAPDALPDLLRLSRPGSVTLTASALAAAGVAGSESWIPSFPAFATLYPPLRLRSIAFLRRSDLFFPSPALPGVKKPAEPDLWGGSPVAAAAPDTLYVLDRFGSAASRAGVRMLWQVRTSHALWEPATEDREGDGYDDPNQELGDLPRNVEGEPVRGMFLPAASVPFDAPATIYYDGHIYFEGGAASSGTPTAGLVVRYSISAGTVQEVVRPSPSPAVRGPLGTHRQSVLIGHHLVTVSDEPASAHHDGVGVSTASGAPAVWALDLRLSGRKLTWQPVVARVGGGGSGETAASVFPDADFATHRIGSTTVVSGSSLFIIAGASHGCETPLARCYELQLELDPLTGACTQRGVWRIHETSPAPPLLTDTLSNAPESRAVGDGARVYTFRGLRASLPFSPTATQPVSAALYAFDLRSMRWALVADGQDDAQALPPHRRGATLAVHGGALWILGGTSGAASSPQSVDVFQAMLPFE
jgi:hypothetical protein